MRILCLVDTYYPEVNANTVCCENIAIYLKNQGHSVDFLALKNNPNDKTYDFINNSNVIRIGTYYDDVLYKYGKKYKAQKWMDFPFLFRKIRGIVQKVKRLARINTGYGDIDTINYNETYRKILKINNHYDCLLTFCMPFAFHVLGNELMKRGLADKWFPIFLDAFEYNECLNPSKINYRKKVAQKILKRANHIFMVKGIIDGNMKKGYIPKYQDKTTEIYIPMLKETLLPGVVRNDSKIKLIYAGLFYRDIRNPEKMLDILSQLTEDCELNLFGKGCEDIIEKKKILFDKIKIKTKGLISHEKCLVEISKSDFLINLGNSITNQMPSKIFEYISFGKPIINFYFTEEDMCLRILKEYPLSININLHNYTQKDIDDLNIFIKTYHGKNLKYEEAVKNLEEYKVENIAAKIYRIMVK